MQSSVRGEAARGSWFPFGVAAVLLFATATVSIYGVWELRGSLKKDAAPLRKPLDRMDREQMGPWTWKSSNTIDPAVLNTLGTDLYIEWRFENEARPVTDPLRYCSILITYYTGKPDMVPHTPEVCYSASGYELTGPCASTSDVVVFSDGEARDLPYRYCEFKKTKIFAGVKFTVVYTFHTNGKLVASRSEVRSTINELTAKHAYFSKIELVFGTPDGRTFPSQEETIEESKKVFAILIPLLERDHFPDWEALEGDGADGNPQETPAT